MTAISKSFSLLRRVLLAIACVLLTIGPGSAAQETMPTGRAAGEHDSFDTLSARAMAAIEADRLDEAVPLFRKALALNPRWTEGWWSLGTVFYDQDRYADAALALQKVTELDPKQGTAHALLGLCQFELGKDTAALDNIEASKELGTDVDPQLRTVIFYHEGVLLQRAGRFVAAQEAFSSLCRSGTNSQEVLVGFGMAALRMRDRQPPADGETAAIVGSIGSAECLAARKDFDAAKEEFAAVIASHPQFPWVHYALARMLVDEHDIPGAVAAFKDELDHNKDRVPVLLQIAAAEYKVDSAAGLPYAEQAVHESPQTPFGHFLLGLLLMNTDAYEKAVPELEAAAGGLPHDPKVFWALSAACQQTGRTQQAAKARAQFLRLKQQQAAQTESSASGASEDVVVNVGDESNPAPEN